MARASVPDVAAAHERVRAPCGRGDGRSHRAVYCGGDDSARPPRVDTLPLKIVLTPALIGAASLAGRRWGPAVSGWLVGLPFTSGPVALFLALEQGPGFAASVATGTLLGTAAQAAFAVAYARLAPRARWPASVAVGSVAFFAVGLGLRSLSPGLAPAAAIALAVLVAALALMPRSAAAAAPTAARPAWDLPARMILATAIVLALTALAPALGPLLTGLLSTFPVYASILAVFAHVLEGRPAGIAVLRGLLAGLFAFAGFFIVLGALIERAGIALGFAAALAVALAVQAASLQLVRRHA